MLRKNLFTYFIIAVVVLSFGVTAFAQTGKAISGKIELKKEDGSKAAAKDVVVELIRIDVDGKVPEIKTDEEGKFEFAELPSDGVYTLIASGAGLNPEIVLNIKVGSDSFLVPISEGNGGRYTEEQARLASLAALKEDGKLSDEQKKMLADYENKKGEVTKTNEIVTVSLEEGNKAFKSGNFDLAVVKFDEGYKAAPTFLGSAPVFLNNKATALKQRSVDTYNTSVKSTDAALKRGAPNKIRADLADVLETVTTNYALLKGASSEEIKGQKNYKDHLASAETIAKDALRILTDLKLYLPSDSEEEAKRSIKIYKDLIKMLPESPDVYAGLGLTLYSAGSLKDNKVQKQDSVNYMAYYMDKSPKDHKMREVIQGLYEYIVQEEKLKPQKIN